jgi:EAL domain-containing protein (putative c-di-GMP-specific phosphodiesterase class I)
MEVLPRWNDPTYGILQPEVYVPVLEESHMIHRHDYQVLKQACRDFAEYRKRGHPAIPIVVNLSYRDLDRDGVVDSIEDLTAGIDRSMINFDISAASLKYLNPNIEETLHRLGELGYQIWMDGFGKGNSTIDILIHHLIQGIKLDIRSIHGIGTDNAQQ